MPQVRRTHCRQHAGRWWSSIGREKGFIGYVQRDMAVLFKGPNADRRKLETFEKRTSGGEYEEMAASAVKEVIASWEKLEEANSTEGG